MDPIYLIGDLLRVVQDANGRFGPTWWRGQPAGKPLIPRAFRDNATHRMEWLRSTRFRQKAAPRHPGVPAEDDHASWLFLMQHYGLPTRLLDWTESPLIAAYFAVRQNNGSDACLWALGPEYLNASQFDEPKLVQPERIGGFFEAPFNEAELADPAFQKIIALVTRESNVRMLQQQSVFTIHGTASPMEELADHSQFLAPYRIPAEVGQTLCQNLIRLGIRESSLFPDLDHLAGDLCQTISRVS